MEYATRYPRTVACADGSRGTVRVGRDGVEHLHIVVRSSVDELVRAFKKEGFTSVKFEHRRESQLGHGLNLKLRKPWEMHVRFLEVRRGLVAIQGEVEVSRDYLQHLFCQSTPVVYEIEEMLRRHLIDYRILHSRLRRYVSSVADNYSIRLSSPSVPVFAWKPMLFVIGSVGGLYLWKFLGLS